MEKLYRCVLSSFLETKKEAGAKLPGLLRQSMLSRVASGDMSRTVGADSGRNASRSCRAFSFSTSLWKNVHIQFYRVIYNWAWMPFF